MEMRYNNLYIDQLITLVHSWYPSECCSEKDCKPVPCTDLLEQSNGTWLYDTMVFRLDQVKPSLDGLCHACFNDYTMKPLCLFIQMNT